MHCSTLAQALRVPVQCFSFSLQAPQVVCISQKLSRPGSETANCLGREQNPFKSSPNSPDF